MMIKYSLSQLDVIDVIDVKSALSVCVCECGSN